MVQSKTELKSVTFKKHDTHDVRQEISRRHGQDESESDITSDSTITDSRSKDTFCVRKDVYRIIQTMADTSSPESASSVSSVMEMAVPKVSNKVNDHKSELHKDREINATTLERNECECANEETMEVPVSDAATEIRSRYDAKCQTEEATQTEALALPLTCLCHYNMVAPLNMNTICNENRYHRMHISQVTAPHPDCTSVPSKESFTSVFEPIRKKTKKKKKPFSCCNRSSATSIHNVPLPGPDGIPAASVNQVQDADMETKPFKGEVPERVDVYYFDHGNSGYYRTTDRPPAIYAEILMDAADETATKFWADVFGALHIGFAFVIHFLLQLLRFLLFSVLRPLTVGIFQLIADYFFKPLLTVLFNGVLQPVLILLYNIATSVRDLCEPLAAAIGFFLKELAAVFRAFRIVEVQKIECCHTHKII